MATLNLSHREKEGRDNRRERERKQTDEVSVDRQFCSATTTMSSEFLVLLGLSVGFAAILLLVLLYRSICREMRATEEVFDRVIPPPEARRRKRGG